MQEEWNAEPHHNRQRHSNSKSEVRNCPYGPPCYRRADTATANLVCSLRVRVPHIPSGTNYSVHGSFPFSGKSVDRETHASRLTQVMLIHQKAGALPLTARDFARHKFRVSSQWMVPPRRVTSATMSAVPPAASPLSPFHRQMKCRRSEPQASALSRSQRLQRA